MKSRSLLTSLGMTRGEVVVKDWSLVSRARLRPRF